MNLDEINVQVRACSRCRLRESATQPVCGIGKVHAKYMLIGEAPGREEDAEGMPFIGAAGRKLNQLLELGGININDCYITNAVKCRPPNNATPTKEFLRVCSPWILAEIREVKPDIIITLGSVPLSLFTEQGVMKLHGTFLDFELNDDDSEDGKRLPREKPAPPKEPKAKKPRKKKKDADTVK